MVGGSAPSKTKCVSTGQQQVTEEPPRHCLSDRNPRGTVSLAFARMGLHSINSSGLGPEQGAWGMDSGEWEEGRKGEKCGRGDAQSSLTPRG